MLLSRWARWILVVVVSIAPLVKGSAHEQEHDNNNLSPIRIMTQNLYVGADLMRIVTEPNPDLIPARVAETLANINATDFPSRAHKIAALIKRDRPDVIALQEVSLLRTQFPGDYLSGNPVAAENVIYDYLDILLGELATHGLHYRVAGIVENADVEVPAIAGFNEQGNPLFMDVRLTDHDAILVRRNIKTWNVTTQNYQINLQVALGNATVEFTRGYVAIDARVRNHIYRVVNTHLELPIPAEISWIQAIQTEELIATFSFSPWPVLLLGDFNSTPEDPVESSGIIPPYLQLSLNNFVDVWLQREGKPSPGYTCCQDELLDNDISALTLRIDHIFMRRPDGDGSFLDDAKVRAWTVGDQPQDKTQSGLWPSDHAGVMTKIQQVGPKHKHYKQHH